MMGERALFWKTQVSAGNDAATSTKTGLMDGEIRAFVMISVTSHPKPLTLQKCLARMLSFPLSITGTITFSYASQKYACYHQGSCFCGRGIYTDSITRN